MKKWKVLTLFMLTAAAAAGCARTEETESPSVDVVEPAEEPSE